MPSSAASGSITSANPPETAARVNPSRRRVRHSVRAPGVSRTAARTSSSTPTGSPARQATRSCRLAAKSSSPRIARSVTAATCSALPACPASSSITSSWIRVESTSMHHQPAAAAGQPGGGDRDVDPVRGSLGGQHPAQRHGVAAGHVELQRGHRVPGQPPDPVDVGALLGDPAGDPGDRDRQQRRAEQRDVQPRPAAGGVVAAPGHARDLQAQLAPGGVRGGHRAALVGPDADQHREHEVAAHHDLLDVAAPRRRGRRARRTAWR